MESTIPTAAPSHETITAGVSNEALVRVHEPAHPVPHPGCALCDPAIVASKRARFGLGTRLPGAPNGWQFLQGDRGVIAVPVATIRRIERP